MPRSFFIIIAAALALIGAPSSAFAEKLKAVTTFTVIADMARNVAGDAATVESITKPGSEIHGYEPTPRDILRARDATLLAVGHSDHDVAEMAEFAPKLRLIRDR
ncbi:MAG: zinc ABC transporter substrate-binding protein, partial [Pseudomonadota bacterium]